MRAVVVLVVILVAITVTAIVAALLATSPRVVTTQRLRQQVVSRRMRGGAAVARELAVPVTQRLFGPWAKRLVQLASLTTPAGAAQQIRAKLDRAGYPWGLTTEKFMVLRGLSLVAGVVGGVLVAFAWHTTLPLRIVALLGCVVLGAIAPEQALNLVIRNRQNQIRKSLPDIMDLLVVSTEAGVGLDNALMEVTRRRKGPLVDEFRRLLQELRLGKQRTEAWQDLAARTGVEEVKVLVAALLQAAQLGVSTGNTLRTQANAMRSRRSLKVRILAQTMSVKMLFPMIFFIFPALLVVVLGPALVSISGGLRGIGW
jgi:tight adherence protein C